MIKVSMKPWLLNSWMFVLMLALFAACDATPEYAEESEAAEVFEAEEVGDDYYSDWDLNRDTYLDQDEIGAGTYSHFDNDGDGLLSEEEWGLFEGTFAEDEVGEYAEWDVNRDGTLDANEYNTRFRSSGIYDRWDANRDTRIDAEEFGEWERD